MPIQLTFDVFHRVSNEIAARTTIKDIFNLSLVCKAVHDFTYPLILRIDMSRSQPQCTLFPEVRIPRALKFFLESDNARLVGLFLKSSGVGVNARFQTPRPRHREPRPSESVLCHAAQAVAVSVVEFLLGQGANFTGEDYDNPLQYAISNGSIPMTRLLLEHLSLHAKSEPGDQSKSGEKRQKDLNSQLLKNIENYDGRPEDYPNGYEIMSMLLQYCSDVHQKDKHGLTILHRIAQNTRIYIWKSPERNFRKIIEHFIQGGVDVDHLDSGTASCGMWVRRTALNYASMDVRPKAIQGLLESGAEAQGAPALAFTGPTRRYGPPTKECQVPLIYAAPTPLYDILNAANRRWEDWILRGSRMNWKNEYGQENRRPWLWENVQENTCQSVKLLIDHGPVGPQGLLDTDHNIIVDIQTVCAKLNADWPELWSLLLEGGVLDVHHCNEFGQTFLNQLASRCCGGTLVQALPWKPNLVRALIEAGSDPNTIDKSGMTPLHWAILYGDVDLVELLLDLGADPAKEVNGATPTHHAFGKPFTRRGPVARKVMAALRRQLTNILRFDQEEPVRIQAFSQYRKCKWHPILSVCSDPVMRKKYKSLIYDAQYRMLLIKDLLSPFSEISKDENGNTPKAIAENIGPKFLNGGKSLSLKPKKSHRRDVLYSIHLYCSRYREFICRLDCSFCFSFPRRPLDLITGYPRPINPAYVKIT
ncbi:ankyrin repeat-containing domain protein [Xylaria cf. heliscus]|nr:ankyrin repeat-containing domain protein [Xylaria cf. heliscus]